MPSCRNCGSYTKHKNGLCYSCYRNSKKKSGNIYFGKVSWPSGKSTIYVGQTKRSVYKRVGEHKKAQKNPYSRSYTGRGVGFSLLGSLFSTNRFKAEKTIKGFSRGKKIGLAKYGARKYKKKKGWFDW